jgi:hypothetical protein
MQATSPDVHLEEVFKLLNFLLRAMASLPFCKTNDGVDAGTGAGIAATEATSIRIVEINEECMLKNERKE